MTGCLLWIRDPFLQPMAFGFCLLQQNLRAVLSPVCTGFGDEVSFRHCCSFPEGCCISFRSPGTEVRRFLWPCDSIAERTFPVFVDLLNIADDKSSKFRLRLSWCADPEVWPKRIVSHLSNLFRFHIVRAVFYRSPDRIKFTSGFLKNNRKAIVVINLILTEVINNC